MSNSRRESSIAILSSGSGSTAEAFIHATQNGWINAVVGLVVCNNPYGKVGVYDRIDRLNAHYGIDIETVTINSRTHPAGNVGRGQTLAESEAICKKISDGGYGHVALMGYMKKVTGALLHEYGWRPHYTSPYQARMSNTHPGPLPETRNTYGVHASERVLHLGMDASRHTVHLVADEIDQGPILAAHPVGVLPGDTADGLFSRVQAVEKATLPYVLGAFLNEQGAYRGDS